MTATGGAGIGAVMLLAGLAVPLTAVLPRTAAAQWGVIPGENPVFINDSPAATDALARVKELLADGNTDQALRSIQRLLDDPHALVPSGTDAAVYVSARSRVHALLLGDAALLERYRAAQEGAARRDLEGGAAEWAARSRLLTRAGFEAALRLAAAHLEAARFDSALLALRELDAHPDRKAAGNNAGGDAPARAAALLAQRLARYPGSPAAKDLARRWALDVGLPDDAAEPITGPVLPPVRSPLTPNPAPELAGLVSRPVASTAYNPAPPGATAPGGAGGGGGGGAGGRNNDPFRNAGAGADWGGAFDRAGAELRSLPVAAGDTVYIVGESAISALDKLTLEPRWRTDIGTLTALLGPRPGGDRRGGRFRAAVPSAQEDIACITPAGELVLSAVRPEGATDADVEAFTALDSATGRTRWIVRIADLDPSLRSARVRGPAVVEGDVAVVALRKESPERRLWALYLAGINLSDGSLRWLRLIASVGSRPYARQAQVSDAATLDGGVVYRSDRLGVIGAYVAATGEPQWVRRLSSQPLDEPLQAGGPFQQQQPVIFGGRLHLLTPDRQALLVLDQSNGTQLARVEADRLGTPGQPPAYLVRVGPWLAAVGDRQVAFVRFAEPGADGPAVAITATPQIQGRGIRGRAVAAGDQLLLPVAEGLQLVDPATPNAPARIISLEHSGNVVVDASQFIVADDWRLHSFLAWDAADRLLTQRVNDNPADASPAVTLLELAQRAGRTDRVLFALDAAAGALGRAGAERAAEPERLENLRLRAMESARGLVLAAEAAEAAEGSGVAPGAPAAGAAPGAGAAAGLAAGNPGESAVDLELRTALVQRWGELARSAEEKAAHQLSLGALHTARANPVAAVETYQALLEDPRASEQLWTAPGRTSRVDSESTRRLAKLIMAGGRGVYAGFDARADAAAGELLGRPVDASSAEALERVARQFPLARRVPQLWIAAADAHAAAQKSRAASRALELGLAAAERLPDADPAIVGELVGRLIADLRDRKLMLAANDAIRRFSARYPGMAFTVKGQALDVAALAQEIQTAAGQLGRFAAVGLPEDQTPQVLVGYSLETPILASSPTAPALVLRSTRGAGVAIVAPRPGGPEGNELLRQVWASGLEEVGHALVRLDAHQAIFSARSLHEESSGRMLFAVDLATGQVRWRSASFDRAFAADGAAAGAAGAGGGINPAARDAGPDDLEFDTPLDGRQRKSALLVAGDEQTLVLIDRGGRAMAVDADTGATLWARGLPIDRVFDAAVQGGLLAVAGESDRKSAAAVPGAENTLLLCDTRSGSLRRAVPLANGRTRWLRCTARGELVVGMDEGIASVDSESGDVVWVNTQPPAAGTINAWLFSSDLLVQRAPEFDLWSISLASGQLTERALDSRGRLTNPRLIRAHHVPGGRALASPQGVVLFGAGDQLRGLDALGGVDPLLTPIPVQGGFLALQTRFARGGGGVFTLSLLDDQSAAVKGQIGLPLADAPTAMAAIDGFVLVSLPQASIVLRAPVKP